MESSPLNSKSHIHTRSNSLPSRPHPLILQCHEHLDRLRASEETSPSSSSSLSQKLGGLKDLHDCVEKLVRIPVTQETLLQEHHENWVDELLDGSLGLLDACTAGKDALLHTKECTRELQSIIRRKRGGEVELTVEANKFLSSRKVVRKTILKTLEGMKGGAKKGNLSSACRCSLVNLLREVEGVTLFIFDSLLNFIAGSAQVKPSSWFSVPKLLHTRKVACAQVAEENEFVQVDAAMQHFVLNLKKKRDNNNNLPNQLASLESQIQDLEEGLEFLFKRLIKTRVALLNIPSH